MPLVFKTQRAGALANICCAGPHGTYQLYYANGNSHFYFLWDRAGAGRKNRCVLCFSHINLRIYFPSDIQQYMVQIFSLRPGRMDMAAGDLWEAVEIAKRIDTKSYAAHDFVSKKSLFLKNEAAPFYSGSYPRNLLI